MIGLALVHLAPKALAVVPGVWVVGYVGVAARRVFGAGRERWPRTGLKLAALAAGYGLALALGLVVTLGVVALGGDAPTATTPVAAAVAPVPPRPRAGGRTALPDSAGAPPGGLAETRPAVATRGLATR